MVNSITIGGRLTADVELRHCNQGSITCTFTLTNNRKYREIENSTCVEVSLFGSFANAMRPYLEKGVSVSVVGEPTQDIWEYEGKIYSRHRTKAKEINFRTPKKEEQAISNIEGEENYEGF